MTARQVRLPQGLLGFSHNDGGVIVDIPRWGQDTSAMAKLPVVSGGEFVRAMRKIGYELDHQAGSHLILRNQAPPHRRLSVPNHKELAKGTLRSLIREAGLTVEEFVALL